MLIQHRSSSITKNIDQANCSKGSNIGEHATESPLPPVPGRKAATFKPTRATNLHCKKFTFPFAKAENYDRIDPKSEIHQRD